MVQVELGEDLEKRLQVVAQQQGLTVEEFLRRRLIADLATRDQQQRDREHEDAMESLRTFADRYNTTLGPDLTIKDLITEGRV
jgi:hypothetical protein